MRRRTFLALAATLLAGASFIPTAGTAFASADSHTGQSRELRRYPQDFDRIPGVDKEDELKLALQNSSDPLTIVFSKGEYDFDQLFVFKRSNVRICGATGGPKGVTLRFTGTGVGRGGGAGFYIQQASNIEIRDMTVICTRPGGSSVVMDALLSPTLASFADSVTLRNCTLEASNPVITTALTRDLTVHKCKVNVQSTDGFGIVFGGDQGLFVSKSTFDTPGDIEAFSGIFVVGAGAESSEGVRVATVIINRNKVKGRFARAFDLADVRDVRIRKNRISLDGDVVRPGTPILGGTTTGRVGVLIRRDRAAALPQDLRVLKNRVRGAMYGVWLSFVDDGAVSNNDLRKCGSEAQDDFFQEFGGAVRIQLVSGLCRMAITNNDMRDLRSPKTVSDGQTISDVPAVTVVPVELEDACFPDAPDDSGNRLSNGRSLLSGATPGKGQIEGAAQR